MYKFRPQHVIYDTLCMVLQKRAFLLDNADDPTPIPLASYNPKNAAHVLVREIAFGPDSDPSVRGVSLWFNIPEYEVSVCTPQQAKRYRWKKGPKHEEIKTDSKSTAFEIRECFFMIRPNDRVAYELTTKILQHRLATVKAERLVTLSARFKNLKMLQQEKDDLAQEFRMQRRHWLSWAWPMNTGRQAVDNDTPVPSVDGLYVPIIDNKSLSADSIESATEGSAVLRIWDSFISTKFSDDDQSEVERCSPPVPSSFKQRRLTVFERLERGEEICPNRALPHIVNGRLDLSSVDEALLRQSERCWKALLLNTKETHSSNNEWEVVLDHFQNARCKKVLTIIQQ